MDVLAGLLQSSPVPITLSLVVIYTVLAELVPKQVSKINTNAYSSMIEWNLSDRSLKFQLVLFHLYHQTTFCTFVHILTIVADSLLWTMYALCLFEQSPICSFIVILFLCVVQVLTFSNIKLKVAIIVIEIILVGSAVLLYHKFVIAYGLTNMFFGRISLILLLNALLRVFSHFFEELPINFAGSGNKLPIKNWWSNEKFRMIVLNPFTCVKMITIGVVSELQAGLPVRLLTPCLVLLLEQMGFNVHVSLDMPKIRARAKSIDMTGWRGDEDTKLMFKRSAQGQTPVFYPLVTTTAKRKHSI